MYNKNVYKYDDMKRAEALAVRNTVGWYYFKHQLFEVSGADAGKFLDYVCVNRIDNLAVGRERYTPILFEDGTILDDVVVMRLEENRYWVSTLFTERTSPAIKKYIQGMDVEIEEDIDDEWHMYSVQGPRSLEMINAMVETPVDDLKFFSFRENRIGGMDVIINRAGFTGEKLGYEIYISCDYEEEIEALLAENAAKFDGKEVTDFQLMSLAIPTEKGFYYLRSLYRRSPFAVGLAKNINWEKDFIGKEALLKAREQGPTHEMVGFTMKDHDVNIPHSAFGGPGAPVMLNGEEVGRVDKLTWSYVLETAIGVIYAQKDALKIGDKPAILGYEAEIVEMPFVK